MITRTSLKTKDSNALQQVAQGVAYNLRKLDNPELDALAKQLEHPTVPKVDNIKRPDYASDDIENVFRARKSQLDDWNKVIEREQKELEHEQDEYNKAVDEFDEVLKGYNDFIAQEEKEIQFYADSVKNAESRHLAETQVLEREIKELVAEKEKEIQDTLDAKLEQLNKMKEYSANKKKEHSKRMAVEAIDKFKVRAYRGRQHVSDIERRERAKDRK